MYREELVDHIVVESGIDTRSDALDNQPTSAASGGEMVQGQRRRIRSSSEEQKEYPPPMPWLAHNNNHPSQMPWVMQKYSTSDGRLVIKKEKVKRHEYFEAYRSNGRLVLNLVHLIDGEDDSEKDYVEEINEDCLKYSDGDAHENDGGMGPDADPGLEPPVHN